MTLLICNIGTRDLVCADLPKPNHAERAWAATILERYPELRPALSLPIIGKALRYLASEAIIPAQVILIASDQDTAADPSFRAGDTCHSAAVIARMLSDGSTDLPVLPQTVVEVWIIADPEGRGGDPSDYDLVLAFLERRLAALAMAYPHGSAFLEVTGGTPAMTTGLLIAGAEMFGARSELLSVHPRRERPATLGAGRRLLAAPLRATLMSNAATCAYDAALRTFTVERTTIGDRLAPQALETIGPLLAYAYCRYNFDFPGARAALATVPDAALNADVFADLVAQVHAPDRRDLLAEVYHGAAVRYTGGLYADFLTPVVRFEENVLRLLCLERGVVFADREGNADDDGSFIDRTWLRAQSFTLRRDRDDNRNLSSSRSLMRELVGVLTRAHNEDLHLLLAAIDQMQALAYLRNELTHSLDGVRKTDLAVRFAGHRSPAAAADTIVPHMAQIYVQVSGRTLPPSPYTAINTFLARLLQPETP